MNKRDLARVLVRVLGVWMIASGVASFISMLWAVLWPASRFGFNASMLTMPLIEFLRIAIGLHLFFKGAWIANKLVQVDEITDP
ncbi:MAG: hypothetical protein ABSH21_01185 [Verrucomicrobiia bacterium]|jgi:hypothetical protein